MRTRRLLYSTLLGVCLGGGLTACGGGGGGAGPQPPPPPTNTSTTHVVTVTGIELRDARFGDAISVTGLPLTGATVTVD